MELTNNKDRSNPERYDPKRYRKMMWIYAFVHILPMHFVYRTVVCAYWSCRYYNKDDQYKKIKTRVNDEKRQNSWEQYCAAKQDLVLLKVLDACLECAPQLILQIYVFRLEEHQGCFGKSDYILNFIKVQYFQMLKIFLSWFSMTQQFAFYPNDQRLSKEKYRDGIEGTLNFDAVF